jgi:hypothetical protein
VSCLPCWRRRAAWFVEGCHELVVGEVESIQQVELHESTMCIRNLCALLQPCRPASVGYKVLGVRL